jgi:hypothetical protein
MEKIDRLGWTAGISFSAYGTRFGIRVNDPAVLSQVQARLPFGWEPAPSAEVDFLYSLWVGGQSKRRGTRHFHLVYSNAGRVARTLDLDNALERLEMQVELFMALLARNCLFVHAGVVGWQDQAIIIPGRSFSGKTTLVEALVRAGAAYYSDEFAILDRQGRVHPYPRPLSIRNGKGMKIGEASAESLGSQVGQQPLTAGLIVVTEYQAGATWRPRRLPPSQTMLALMHNTIAARRNPELSMPILKQVVSGTRTIKSKRGEAAETAPYLLKLVGQKANR